MCTHDIYVKKLTFNIYDDTRIEPRYTGTNTMKEIGLPYTLPLHFQAHINDVLIYVNLLSNINGMDTSSVHNKL